MEDEEESREEERKRKQLEEAEKEKRPRTVLSKHVLLRNNKKCGVVFMITCIQSDKVNHLGIAVSFFLGTSLPHLSQ